MEVVVWGVHVVEYSIEEEVVEEVVEEEMKKVEEEVEMGVVAAVELAVGRVDFEETYRMRRPRAHLFGGPFSTVSPPLQIYRGVHRCYLCSGSGFCLLSGHSFSN